MPIKMIIPVLALMMTTGLAACTTVEPADPVVTRTVVMTCEEPEEKTCPDCEPWKTRVMQAEEKNRRLQDQLQNCLRK